ncbi:MAG: methyltransferase domain-containing protein [Ferruginibacter sp.]
MAVLKPSYSKTPVKIHQGKNREIADFTSPANDQNIDMDVVKSFGDEWTKFHTFSKSTLKKICDEYFDIVDASIVNGQTRMIDIGCGSGRWSEYFTDKAGFIDAVDPSEAIFAADDLLEKKENIRLTRASVNTLPWDDETFDFGMSIGVLHHIPDTGAALASCVKKIKKGGYFYLYIYYKLDNRGPLFKFVFGIADMVRRTVCKLPPKTKKTVCDILAVVAYMPFVYTARFFKFIGLKKFAERIPLYAYANKDFYIIRNDSLDRFGTKLEQRFTKQEITSMMKNAGLEEIRFSDAAAFWHAVGKRVR